MGITVLKREVRDQGQNKGSGTSRERERTFSKNLQGKTGEERDEGTGGDQETEEMIAGRRSQRKKKLPLRKKGDERSGGRSLGKKDWRGRGYTRKPAYPR